MQLRACGVMLSQLVRLFPTPSGQQRAELELEAGVGVRRVLQSATRAQARISRSVEQRAELVAALAQNTSCSSRLALS